MSRSLKSLGVLGLTCVLGVALAACPDTPETLVTVQVGDSFRGDGLALISADRVLVSADSLAPEESGYIANVLECGGNSYVQLKPEVGISFLEAQQRVQITPNPKLLSTWTYDLTLGSLPLSSNLPLLRVDYQVGGRADPSQVNQQASLNAEVRLEKGVVGASVAQSYRTADGIPKFGVGARLGYDFTPELESELLFQGRSLLSNEGDLFSGARLRVQGIPRFQLERLEFDLPTATTLEVYDNGFLVQGIPAKAGHIVLLNVPLHYASGVIVVRDSRGSQLREWAKQSYTTALGQGGQGNQTRYSAVLEGGLLGSNLFTAASARWEPDEHLTLEASGQWRELGFSRASAQVGYRWSRASLGLGLSSNWDPLGVAQLQANASAGLSVGNWGLSAQVNAPLERLEDFQASISSGFSTPETFISVNAQYSGRSGSWSQSLNAGWQPSPELTLSSFASVSGSNSRFGVRGSYSITPQDRVQAEVSSRPSLSYSRALDSENTVKLTTDFQGVQAEFQTQSVVDGFLLADSSGYAMGDLRGSLTLVQGLFSPSRLAPGSVLVLHLGVPNVRVFLGGQAQGRTDSSGDLVLTGVQRELAQLIRLEINDLPLEVLVKQKEFSVRVVQDGVYELDLRDQFSVSQFMQLKWSASEAAADAKLIVGRKTYLLDGQGYTFVENLRGETSAKLTDGDRTCAVVLKPQLEEVVCVP